jgi:hypothetical protein
MPTTSLPYQGIKSTSNEAQLILQCVIRLWAIPPPPKQDRLRASAVQQETSAFIIKCSSLEEDRKVYGMHTLVLTCTIV